MGDCRDFLYDLRLRAGSTVVGELFLKLLAGEEDAALYGAQRERHLFGYLIVFVAGHA